MPAAVRKTVRFADEEEYTYYSPSPSSPAYSDRTLSSTGLITPPHPFPVIDLRSIKGAVVVHPILGLASTPQFFFDLSLARDSSSAPPLSPRILAQPATHPPLPQLRLRCNLLPWTISIPTASAKPDAFVTVADVLEGLRSALRTQVRADEFNNETPERRASIALAFERRTSKDPTFHEYKKGLRIIDFLAGKNVFLGLSRTTEGPEVWKLHVGD